MKLIIITKCLYTRPAVCIGSASLCTRPMVRWALPEKFTTQRYYIRFTVRDRDRVRVRVRVRVSGRVSGRVRVIWCVCNNAGW